MAKFAVELSRRAFAELEGFPPETGLRIATKLAVLEVNPAPRGSTIKRLRGFSIPTFRLRIGDYRAVFRLDKEKVIVLRIIHRRELERALVDLS